MTRCRLCEQAPCACEMVKPVSPLRPLHSYTPLQTGPYVTMEEALADEPELLARLKRVLGGDINRA